MRREGRSAALPLAVVLVPVLMIVMLLGGWMAVDRGYGSRSGPAKLLLPETVLAAEDAGQDQAEDTDPGGGAADPAEGVCVAVSVVGQGTVNGRDSDYTETLAAGETLLLQIQAAAGHVISDIRINETSLYSADQESVIGSRTATEELEDLEDDLSICVEFSEDPGTGADDGADTGEDIGTDSGEPPEDGTTDPVLTDGDEDDQEDGEDPAAEETDERDDPGEGYDPDDPGEGYDPDDPDNGYDPEDFDDGDWTDPENGEEFEDGDSDDLQNAAGSENTAGGAKGQEADPDSDGGGGKTDPLEMKADAEQTDADSGSENIAVNAGGGTRKQSQRQTLVNKTSGQGSGGTDSETAWGKGISPRTGDSLPMVSTLILLCSLTALAIIICREHLRRERKVR